MQRYHTALGSRLERNVSGGLLHETKRGTIHCCLSQESGARGLIRCSEKEGGREGEIEEWYPLWCVWCDH